MSDQNFKNQEMKNSPSNVHKIIRAWRDPDFRRNLKEEELACLPPHPAGDIDLSGTELDKEYDAKGKDFVMVGDTYTASTEECCSSSLPCHTIWDNCEPLV